ncbi:site-specific integrase [Vreelandella lionensis]|uniref:Site-specific integrase n=1 Tax=Vreelandella lionensis TaxID=1144478 RepID=A0ABW8BPB6_9GAMM
MATYQKRGARWRAIVRKKGHAVQSKTFTTKARAQVWANQVERDLEAGLIGQGVAPTLGDLMEGHLRHLDVISSRGRKNKTAANNLLKGFDSEWLVSDLTYQHLADYCRARIDIDGVSPATVQLDILFLSGAVTTAVVEGRLHSEYKSKVSAWRKGLQRAGLVGHPESRDRRPLPDELAELLTHTKHNRALRRINYYDLVRFAVDSCMRLDEICSLRWDDFSPEDGTVVVRLRKHPTKKTDQVVPLMGEAQAIIEAQPREDELIFPFNSESVSNGFRRICTYLDIKNLHFHDLRHEGISRLFERGYQIQEVAMVSGHRDWKSLQRYVNLRPAELAARDRAR